MYITLVLNLHSFALDDGEYNYHCPTDEEYDSLRDEYHINSKYSFFGELLPLSAFRLADINTTNF